MKSAVITKILSTIENPTREQIKQAWEKHKSENKKYHKGLYLPSLQKPCGGCGKEEFKPELYFGEVFCSQCVEKWKAGEK